MQNLPSTALSIPLYTTQHNQISVDQYQTNLLANGFSSASILSRSDIEWMVDWP